MTRLPKHVRHLSNLARVLGIGRATVYRYLKDPRFPRKTPDGWPAPAVALFLELRHAERLDDFSANLAREARGLPWCANARAATIEPLAAELARLTAAPGPGASLPGPSAPAARTGGSYPDPRHPRFQPAPRGSRARGRGNRTS